MACRHHGQGMHDGSLPVLSCVCLLIEQYNSTDPDGLRGEA